MNYAYNNNFTNPYSRPFSMPNYGQPQFQMPMQQQQMAQMQSQPQMQQPMQPTMPIDTPIQYVGYATLKEAEAYILMPNTKGLFIDKNSGSVYEKVCGANGQSEIIHYKKVDANANVMPVVGHKEEVNQNVPEFATKTDLKGFVTIEEYENLKEELKGLQGQIKGLKQTPKAKAENKIEKSE